MVNKGIEGPNVKTLKEDIDFETIRSYSRHIKHPRTKKNAELDSAALVELNDNQTAFVCGGCITGKSERKTVDTSSLDLLAYPSRPERIVSIIILLILSVAVPYFTILHSLIPFLLIV